MFVVNVTIEALSISLIGHQRKPERKISGFSDEVVEKSERPQLNFINCVTDFRYRDYS